MSKVFASKFIILILWPLGSLIQTLNNPKSKYFSIFFLSFAVYIGLNVNYLDVSDFFGYVTESIRYKNMAYITIFKERDFFYPLLSKFLNNISSNFYFISASFTLIYFYFFLKCIKTVINNTTILKSNSFYVFLLIALYTVHPFVGLFSFRFNTATLFYSWCILEFMINKRKAFLLYILATPIIHFSFLIFIPLPFIYILVNKFNSSLTIGITIFVLSIIYSNLQISYFINTFSERNLSSSVSTTVNNYASEEGQEANTERYKTAAQSGSIYRAINRGITKYSRMFLMYSLLIIILTRYKYFNKYPYIKSIFLMSILSYSFANFASSVYHGSRFYALAGIIFYYSLYYVLCLPINYPIHNLAILTKYKWIFKLIIIVILINFLNVTYMSRFGINYLNIIFGNWITALAFFSY